MASAAVCCWETHLSVGLTFLLLCLLQAAPHCLWPHVGSPQPRPKQLEVVTTGAAQQLFLEPTAAVRKLQKNRGGFCAVGPGAGASPQPVRNRPPRDKENFQSRPAGGLGTQQHLHHKQMPLLVAMLPAWSARERMETVPEAGWGPEPVSRWCLVMLWVQTQGSGSSCKAILQ